MNPSFVNQNTTSDANWDRTYDKDHPFQPPSTALSDPTAQKQQFRQPQHPRTSSHSLYPQQAAPASEHNPDTSPPLSSMYQAHHQSKLHRQQLQHSEQHQHRPQQLPAQAYPPGQQQHQAQGFGVPRTVSTPAWVPSTNQTFHASASSAISTARPPAPSSSSSSGSLLSYWDRSAASDSELRMATTLPPSGPYHHHHAMSDMGHHRHASSAAFLPSVSPSGIVAHPSSASHMGSSGRTHSYGSAGSEHYHPYRPSSMPSVESSMSVQQHGSPSSHQQASSSGPSYPSSVSAPLTSPGFVYGPSGSSAPLGPGTSYDTYPQSFQGAHSQHVFYLPPAMPHDSRFYPLNPFEIKHRRRTTKAQFCLLESTFREVPKPNATLRKQISTQLDMPVRAVQIWFQNRRAKAKAKDKKRQSDGGRGGADSQDRPSMGSGVASHHHYNDTDTNERRGQTSSEMHMFSSSSSPSHEQQQVRNPMAQFEGQGRRTSRSMDLPPLRIQADQSRPDVYCSGSSTSTLPSRTTETGQTRDRRGFATPPISAGADSWSQQALGLSYSTLSFDSQEQAEHLYSMRSGAAHGMPATAPLGQSHASASDPSAGMPSGLDRPSRPTSLSSYSGRESSMLSGSSPRPIGYESSRYWSAPQ
ncbi:hypothetical protein NDA11_005573 [Ustilago hordei]|nr:hypothetical protein NDA10_003576 [Ustilago hordei]KAJ1570193.1 hypothetical protein NDA12_002927 [Ustilago hordei]KAJ1572065.1 hypothetical protein NDA15_004024 [Ustilago hordei]KAJ1574306.1 hypothetical protein NDA11_005573 [Ustilago hordei]KAJ1594604.1 hypothetical protein NDA14_003837 [Ustilago hordei]